MSHSYRDGGIVNDSTSPEISSVIEARLSRRDFVKTAAALAVTAIAPLAGCVSAPPLATPRFSRVEISTDDRVRVPPGYTATAMYKWGDPIGHPSGSPAFRPDAGNTAEEQALQAGMHHDGIQYFPLPYGSQSSTRGLLAINHEYTDDGLLHTDGFSNWSRDKVRKAQNAHGCSVVEVEAKGGRWSVVRPSSYARRITASTPIAISGPAGGAPAMRTSADASGLTALGTFNNCAHGYTPWGTYLTCEENWDTYFVNSATMTEDQRRNGITAKGRGYRWHEFDERFDAGRHPNEPNRHGWVVEFDPYDPGSTPVKRTALGRFSHEGAWTTLAADGRLVVYLGDDRTFEYIYKFVSAQRVDATDRKANRDLLDRGTLYAARFNDDGTGSWLPLVHGTGALTRERGFADQADVLIRTRAAADALKATPMDRPEWIAVQPRTKEVYCTLTNNTSRGAAGAAKTDAPNPRAPNVFGHIIRWREKGGDPASGAFDWDIYTLAGDPRHADVDKRGNIRGDAFGSPDGLWFDPDGLLWIQTDISTSTLNRNHYERLGNNQMLCADTASGEIRRFLTGPSGCEITGVTMTPDMRTMFINIQHPGETSSERSDPLKPHAVSTWPDGPSGGRPRSATVVIRRDDGGRIGT
ncbi:MAG: Tat pathway signal protein [Betaproteobacteria bacterium]|nr:Tat pathway signal protein [Betaproteobacteria bacterium]